MKIIQDTCPTVTDESHSDDLGPQVENPGGAMNNQKWRLKGDQWISLDASERTPLPTPSTDDGMHNSLFISSREQAQAHVTLLSGAGVPFKSLEDRFVVNMPSAREPCPKTMTPQQIADFQQACHQVYRYNNDMVDPERAPSPRAMTPGGPSTPPRKLFKIRDTLLQSAGPIERGRRGDRPPGQPHNPNTQGGPRQWRHSSAPPGGQPQHGWREQTNRSFLEDSRVYGREGGIQQMPNRRPVDPHQQMRWRPVPPDPYRPPGQYDRRSPRCSQYQSRRSPSMPRYPQEPHPHYRSTGPIERRNIDSNQGRRLSREIRLEPQSQASQTLQLGALKGDDLLATITTTTTTSTVTPIRLNSGEMEGYFTPDEATSKKSSSGQYHRASGESVATTTTRTGSVVSVDNAEKLRDGSQLTAVNITKFGGNTQGADGSIPTLGTQDGGTKDTNSSTPNWLSVQIASFTRRAFRNLLPMAIFCLTLAALTCRGYYQYMASRVPPELKTAQGVRSLKVIGGVLIVAIAISVILKFSAKDFYFGGSRDKIHTN
ncbi:hypothetical protein FQN49_004455 [Arthroderma sp. PD_2]|nr:hypothetical protein FQN49_004455 [Arthroderma sp. PD_2]